MTNNYIKLVRYGQLFGLFFFDDRHPDEVREATINARAVAMETGARASAFRWRPGMANWLGSTLTCGGLVHDWKPNPFDKGDTKHPGWTCKRCALTCTEKDAVYDPTTGRVPEHKEWSRYAKRSGL